MTATAKSPPRAIADVSAGLILASVEIAAPPERVFEAIAREVADWWGAPGVYRVTEHEIDLRKGGAWRSSGVSADGKRFSVGGEVLELDPPRLLVQSWKPDWEPGPATTIRYQLVAIPGGTRITVRHEGFGDRAAACESHAQGWERVLSWLDAYASRIAENEGSAARR